MIYFTYRLQVKGSFSKKGFGFSCMHMAYDFNLTGTLFYESTESVILEITGREEDIEKAIKQCKNVKFINEVLILNKTKAKNKLNDFIMLNQID